MKKILLGLSITLVMVFTGCGGGSSSESSGGGGTSSVDMELNSAYVMSAGGEITKTSTDANVTLETIFSTGNTRATLTSGTATCTGCTKVN